MAKANEAGKAFLEGLLNRSKLSADAKKALLEDDAILTEVGDGVLQRSEASRLADDLNGRIAGVKKTEADQKSWWDQNKDAVAERDRLKAAGGGGGGGVDHGDVQSKIDTAVAAAVKGMRDDMAQLESVGVGLATISSRISVSHLNEFHEVVDVEKVAQDAIKNKRTLVDEYNAQVSERRATRDKAAREKELADATEAGRKAGMMEALNRQGAPYPINDGSGPSTLSGLRKPAEGEKAPDYSLEAAVRVAQEVMAKG